MAYGHAAKIPGLVLLWLESKKTELALLPLNGALVQMFAYHLCKYTSSYRPVFVERLLKARSRLSTSDY